MVNNLLNIIYPRINVQLTNLIVNGFIARNAH